jgi:BirA family biotin operon repressor/biotin-[acetyl-CoA-carboxylase] ligase
MRGDRARPALAATRFADVRWVAETGSTNADLADLAAGGAAEGRVLVADHQTAGRGRLDRSWVAPPGSSLLVSVLLRPAIPASDAALVTLAMALAAVDACELVADVRPQIKWPNDLVVSERDGGPTRKLAGILAASSLAGSQLDAVVVGIGINVNWGDATPEQLSELGDTAVALDRLTGHDVDREDLLIALMRSLDERYDAVVEPSRWPDLVEAATLSSATIGRDVEVDLGSEVLTGRAIGLTRHGGLELELESGDRRTILTGDVVHARVR